MDFSTLNTSDAAESGSPMHVEGPDEQPLFYEDANGKKQPVTITVMGADSATYRREVHRISGTKRTVKVRKGGIQVDSRQAEQERIELMAACTLAWDGIEYGSNEPFPCNRVNAKRLYTELPWLRDQVSEFMEDRTNFLGE